MDNMDFAGVIFAALTSGKKANERIDNLPLPMVFKGTLGTGGTISTLPTASSENEGYVYIVITDGTYAGTSAKAGDIFVSDGSSWVLVPSADEPSPIDDSVTSTALTWSSDKISTALNSIVKSFEYVGNNNNDIVFTVPTDCHMILDYATLNPDNNRFLHLTSPIQKGVNGATVLQSTPTDPALATRYYQNCAYSWNGNEITFSGTNLRNEYNRLNVTYTVYYI